MPAAASSSTDAASRNPLSLATAPRSSSAAADSTPPGRVTSPSRGSTRPAKSTINREQPLPSGPISSHGLQNGLLLVLALYASLALLNLGSALSALSQGWQQFVEFMVSGLW